MVCYLWYKKSMSIYIFFTIDTSRKIILCFFFLNSSFNVLRTNLIVIYWERNTIKFFCQYNERYFFFFKDNIWTLQSKLFKISPFNLNYFFFVVIVCYITMLTCFIILWSCITIIIILFNLRLCIFFLFILFYFIF